MNFDVELGMEPMTLDVEMGETTVIKIGEDITVKVKETEDGAEITVEDAAGTQSATIYNGKDGAPGKDGAQGAPGATPDIQIGTVKTLEAGSDATATITGTPEEPILNLGIPKGADGSTDDFMAKNNPVGTGSFSMNRASGSTVGVRSFAAGNNVQASGTAAHAEGLSAKATNTATHAEGYNTVAMGAYSHAEGCDTRAVSLSQHVQGEYNVQDAQNPNARSTYAHIVGNGTSSARSNAHTLDWYGNAWFAGDVYVGSTGGTNKDAGSKKLITADDDVITTLQAQIEALTARVAALESGG